MIVDFVGPVFRWDARSDAWFFTSLPEPLSEEIREIPRIPRGFGSIPVRVSIGRSTWRTSIFPDGSRGTYVLPLKKSVRVSEGIVEGDDVGVSIELLDG